MMICLDHLVRSPIFASTENSSSTFASRFIDDSNDKIYSFYSTDSSLPFHSTEFDDASAFSSRDTNFSSSRPCDSSNNANLALFSPREIDISSFCSIDVLIEAGENFIEVRRDNCLEDTLTYIFDNQLNWRQPANIKFTLEVTFK